MLEKIASALTIVASTVTLAIESDAMTGKALSPISDAAARTTVQSAALPFRHVPYESTECRTAKRQVTMYGQALTQLNMTNEKHRNAAAIYRQARDAESLWRDQHCRA